MLEVYELLAFDVDNDDMSIMWMVLVECVFRENLMLLINFFKVC
jgi:hypothetical protein